MKGKELILDLKKHIDKEVRVKFTGGREGKGTSWLEGRRGSTANRVHTNTFFIIFVVTGVLKGYDPLVNLVLDNSVESLRGKVN